MISSLHIHYYWYYNLRRASPPFIGCLHAAQRKKSPYSEFFWSACSAFGLNIQSECGKHLTATYYLRRLHTTFDGYVLLLAWHDCDFARIQDFPAIFRICGLKGRLEFNNNLLVLVQFYFFCSLMFSSINFNLPIWKCCFIKNTQMLKMWNFLHLALQMVCKGNN